MSITIHRISQTNAAVLENVDPDVFDHEIQPALLANYLADPRHAMFVAVDDDLVVGQIRGSVHLQPDRSADLYIDNLGTAPSHQRRGIASGMMKEILAWGQEQGCAYAWVATETHNDGARGFYAASGFTHDTIAMYGLELA